MKVEQKDNRERSISLFAVFGRIVAFAAVAFAICALAKPLVCGRACEDCPCHNEGESAGCSNQDEPAESA